MKNILIFILIFAPFILSAQNAVPILTKEQNAEWITALEQQDLQRQLEMLKKRWEEDTKIHYSLNSIPHKPASASRVGTNCRPLYLFISGEEKPFFLPPNPTSEAIENVSKMLNSDNISALRIETGIKMQAIYGQRGSCGVIYLTVPETIIFERIASEVIQ